MIRSIEISFAIPVDLTDDERQSLDKFVQRICKRHEPDGWCYWPSGYGSKPNFSQADSMFLGKPVDPNAPVSGEPTFDHEVYSIDTCAREAWPEEIERDRKRAEAKVTRERSLKYRAWRQFWMAYKFIGDCFFWCETGRRVRE